LALDSQGWAFQTGAYILQWSPPAFQLVADISAPPTPIPPPPPPPVSKVFIVFYDWGRSEFPEGGRDQVILQLANEAWRSNRLTKIVVTGYTDTSEPNPLVLSETRVHNAVEAFVSYGIPRNRIQASGRGEQDLRVPTGPGVREPQNRRVEILIQ
jgi:OOP family OmpA-OmpF porin